MDKAQPVPKIAAAAMEEKRPYFKVIAAPASRSGRQRGQGKSDKKLYTAARQEPSPLLPQGLKGFVKKLSPVKKPAVPEGAAPTWGNAFRRKTARQQ